MEGGGAPGTGLGSGLAFLQPILHFSPPGISHSPPGQQPITNHVSADKSDLHKYALYSSPCNASLQDILVHQMPSCTHLSLSRMSCVI